MQTHYKLNHSLFIFGLMILFFIAAFPLVQAQSAAPGDLDLSFGSGGKVVTAFTSDDSPTRVRIQPDGKIVTVGIVQNAALKLTATFVVRHNANGSVDTSFGRNGSFIAPCCDDAFGSPVFYDFVVQPDGKLLLTGGAYTGNFYYGIETMRLNANGTLDNTFGYNGGAFTALYDVGDNIALQADGKIVVLGSTFSSPNVADKVALIRYNANGTLDTSFGAGGTVITTVGTNLLKNRELLIQPDGKILAAGHANFSGNINAYVARYNIDGTLDTGFGTNGIVGVDINSNFNKVGRMALQPDGKIVVNGENFNNPGNAVISSSIFRLDANGAVDTTFGTNGFVIIPAANGNEGVGKTLALQQNGKILTAGQRSGTFATLRYNSNGTIDNSFGSNGVVTTFVGSNPGADGIASLAVQPDGKIVATGEVRNAYNFFDVGLVRYLGDAVTTAPRTRFDFDGDGKADVSVFRPSNGAWYLNQSSNGFTAAQFGISTDKIVPADYDGDGKTDYAVYRDGTWFLLRSSAGFTAFQFGLPADIPQPADFDGDGKAELVVYRPSNGVWYVFNLVNNNFNDVQFGLPTDKAVVGDYDGDGKADYAVYRPSSGIWYLLQSTAGFAATQFGIAEDKPVVGDYDGDGRADIAVYRPSSGIWYLLRSSQGFTAFQFGIATDLPTPGDYDGDGKTDISFYRPSNGIWYLQNSTNGFSAIQYGLPSDKPIPNAFVP